jgi:PAS domain S-box-containing protein
MKDEDKSKAQLITELVSLRQQVAELKTLEAEHEQTEAALRKSEALYHDLVETSQDLIWKCDAEGRFTFLNQAWEKTHGYKIEEMLGRRFTEFQTPEAAARDIQEFSRHLSGGMVTGYETTHLSKSGEVIHLVFNAIPVYDASGSIVGTQGTAYDITERKRMEEALGGSEERYQTLFQTMTQGVVYQTADGKITAANPAAEQILGLTLDQMQGRTSMDPRWRAIHEDGSAFPGERHPSMVALKSGKEVHDVVMGVFNPLYNEYRWININAVPQFRPGESTPYQVYTTFEDITQRKQAEQALKEYSERLEEMVEERTRELREAQEQLVRQEKLAVLGQLAGGVGHELRNPLGVLTNAAYFLKMTLTETDETIQTYLDMISSQVRKAEKIVSDLLDFARLETAEKQETPLPRLVTQVLAEQSPPEQVEVSTQMASDLPLVFVDSQQIEQVLTNLVINAYQAMADGGRLTISATTGDDQVALSITDTGHGISEENMTKLFEPLFTTRPKGIGLGLAVSKNLVEANGGRIEVESEEGEGSTFTIILPVREMTS